MILSAPLRKLVLTTHITSSVGWLGALTVFFAHALAGLLSQDEPIVRATSLAMGLTAWLVILPLSLASLASGLLQALGSAWGLLRHYWVLFKLVLTVAATAVLLLKLAPIGALADAAAKATFSSGDLGGLRMSLTIHAAGGVLVLLAAAALAVYKPAGMTRYGLTRQREHGGAAGSMNGGTPTWVKATGVACVILALLVVVMLAGGDHGPGAHLPGN